MIKGLGRSNSAHFKGSARSVHSCNVINDVHPSKRDGGRFASEGHKNGLECSLNIMRCALPFKSWGSVTSFKIINDDNNNSKLLNASVIPI